MSRMICLRAPLSSPHPSLAVTMMLLRQVATCELDTMHVGGPALMLAIYRACVRLPSSFPFLPTSTKRFGSAKRLPSIPSARRTCTTTNNTDSTIDRLTPTGCGDGVSRFAVASRGKNKSTRRKRTSERQQRESRREGWGGADEQIGELTTECDEL